MHRILGIDLGATAVKAVAVEASFRAHTVRAFRSEPVPATLEGEARPYHERALAALRVLSEDGWLQADTIVCCLPFGQVATHLVTLPFTDTRRIEQALPFEVEGLMPFDLDDVIFDYQVLSKASNRSELLVAVARREDVQATLELFAEVGADPNVITFSALALNGFHTEGYLPAPPAPEPDPEAPADQPPARPVEAILDIGAERSALVISEGPTVRFARSLSAGGAEVTRAIVRALGHQPETAELLKQSLDLYESRDELARAAAERCAASLLREVRATIAAHEARTHHKVTRLRLCGGGSRLRGLPDFLADGLGLEVDLLALNEGRSFPEPESLDTGALALGLALTGVGGTRASRLTFRRGPFASRRDQGALQDRIRSFAVMAAVLLVLFGVSTWSKLYALEKREKQLDGVLCETTQKILGKCETDIKVALGRLKGSGSPAAAVPSISGVELALLLGELFPEDADSVLSDLDIVDTTVRLRGDAGGYQAVEDLVAKLEGHKCFTKVEKGRMAKGREGRIDFDIDALYGCGRADARDGS